MTLQVPAWQSTGHTEALTEIQAEHCELEKIINPWAAMGVNSWQVKKKTISTRSET